MSRTPVHVKQVLPSAEHVWVLENPRPMQLSPERRAAYKSATPSPLGADMPVKEGKLAPGIGVSNEER